MDNYNFLLFDVETNGIGDFRPPTQTMTQIAFLKFNRDGTILDTGSYVVRGATELSKNPAVTISKERIKEEGIDVNLAINKLLNIIDKNTVLVSHNYDFDSAIIDTALRKHGSQFPNIKHFCTMKASTNYCKIPRPYYNEYKYPKLIELAEKLGIPMDPAKFHDALYDCIITKKCFLTGLDRGIFKL